MTTAKSSFSMSRFLPVYKNLLRRNRGSALFYGVLGFLFFSLQYLLSYLEYIRYTTDNPLRTFSLVGPANIYNGFAVVFFTGMSLVVPLVLATNLFGYMQNKRSVDVYHALPLTRSELYLATSAAGMTLIWIPLILNFLFVAGCALLVGGQNLGMIFLELLCWMVITFVIFALTAFSAVNVGTTFDTAIFSLGLNASLAAVYMTVIAIGSAFLYGFYDIDSGMEVAYRLSPVSLMIGRQALNGLNSTKMLRDNDIAIALWLVAGVVVFVIGMLVYKKRRSEQAESVGNLGPLQMFLRSAGTLVGGAMLGAVFCGVFGFDNSKMVFLTSLAVGALITYFIGDVILTRTVRSIPRALPAAFATTLVVCLLAGGVMYGGFGYEKRVPSYESVASVTLENYGTRYESEPSLHEDYNNNYQITDPEAIKLILQAHGAQVESHFADPNANENYDGSLRVKYTLKNGKTLSRRYYGLYPAAREALLELEVHPELIRQTHASFKGTAEMISSVTVTNALGNNSKALALTNEQKQQLLEAVRTDLLAQPISEIKTGVQALGCLSIEYQYIPKKNGEIDSTRYMGGMAIAEEVQTLSAAEQEYSVATSEVLITESYKNTRELLEKFGAGEQLQNDFSQVKKAYIGVIGYRFRNQDVVVMQSSEQLMELNDIILRASYYDKEYYDKEYYGEKSKAFVQVDTVQLTAIRKDLTSIYALQVDNPYVVVGISDERSGVEVITGCYYMPLESLSEQMKYKVCESARSEYGDDYLINMGYHYFG
ncbi:MAG: hypothetical protein K0S22_330 [Oscillospiraceae bacterium]|jgi:hypothetical protein|nr:hypothetical protein [Oscillospiraceae bacterium]